MGVQHPFTTTDPHTFTAPQSLTVLDSQDGAPTEALYVGLTTYGHAGVVNPYNYDASHAWLQVAGPDLTSHYTGKLSGAILEAWAGGSLVDNLVGADARINIPSGTTTQASAVEASLSVAAGATLTSGIGLRVKSPVNAGTIGILYGLKIEDQIQGGSNYALSTGAGRVSFGDTVAFVGGAALPGSISSSATAGLAIQGKAGSSVDLIIRNATGNGVMQLAPGGSTPIFPNGVNLGQTTLTQYQEGSFTPTFNNLVVVNGTGSASYTGRYTRVGNRVDWEVVIGVSGTCTVAANSSSTTITNLPFSSANSSVLVASDNAARNYGTGVVIGGATTAYVPTWAAVNNAVVITGTLLL